MSKTIKQIDESEVLTSLCNDKPVYRFNTETGTSADLTNKSIKTISKDFNNSIFLYFTVGD